MTAQQLAIVKPIDITDAILTGTDVPEADYPAWSAGTTYAIGALVILTGTHQIYTSLQDGNVGKDPATDTSSPPFWKAVRPTNRWRAFDTSNSTRTAQATSFYYELTPGQVVDSFAALSMAGVTSLRLRMTDPVYGVVYDQTTDLSAYPRVADWWDWYFGSWVSCRTTLTVLDLPAYPNAVLRVDLTGGADLAVGTLVFGQSVRFGSGVKLGASIGMQDYSIKATNDFGDSEFIERAYARRASIVVPIGNDELEYFADFLAEIRAVPCLYVAPRITVFGTYGAWDGLIDYPMYSLVNIDLKGLT